MRYDSELGREQHFPGLFGHVLPAARAGILLSQQSEFHLNEKLFFHFSRYRRKIIAR